ncbi:MAG: pyrimidine 5'-nucleotidase [Anaerolineae bacterium]|nr:pyrimidine 5'-nucleotidase [Anaerolineae bacterium]
MRYVLFDLDETLYPRHAGVMQQISVLMTRYIVERLGLTEERAHALRRRYWEQYGTTLAGLRANYHIDPQEFLAYVHNLPVEKYLIPNGELDAALGRISLTKVVFTNASREHAQRVLDVLGIAPRFSRIFDIADTDYVCKPNLQAYHRLLELLGARAEECVLVEDNTRNLAPAKALGMVTILVDGEKDANADFVIGNIVQIGGLVERLLAAPGAGKPD